MLRRLFRVLFRLFPVLYNVSGLKQNPLDYLPPDRLAAEQELEIHTEVLKLLLLRVCMIALASGSVSRAIRCSYQLMASASSITDMIIRANVRTSSESSAGGS